MNTQNIRKSFRVKITLVIILAMLFAGSLGNYLIYKYSLKSQFNQLREQLMIIADTATLTIDADTLLKVPLTKDGVNSPYYKEIVDHLLKIKDISPSISYIYTMTKGPDGELIFLVDPQPDLDAEGGATSFPGDRYDSSEFPEMKKAFYGTTADKELGSDAWGVFLSGYAPIYDANGRAVAILGVDLKADDVYTLQKDIKRQAILVLVIGVFISILLGTMISRKVTDPINRLVEGTRHIARGNLDYNMEVKGNDEISELGRSFTKMSVDLKQYIEELKVTTAEKEGLLKELEIAKDIQQSFLPDAAPSMEKFDIAVSNIPAKQVGGDFHDFIPVDENRWGLTIGDVAGKGIPAALFMALSRTLVRANAIGETDIVGAIQRANTLITEDSHSILFLTLFYGILNSKKMILRYINAGHNPPLLFKNSSEDMILLEAKGIPLALFDHIELQEDEIELKEGDVLVLYTDGMVEAVNSEGEQFGIERLSSTAEMNRHLSAHDIMAKIHEALDLFVSGQPQFDDLTIMVIKVREKSGR